MPIYLAKNERFVGIMSLSLSILTGIKMGNVLKIKEKKKLLNKSINPLSYKQSSPTLMAKLRLC